MKGNYKMNKEQLNNTLIEALWITPYPNTLHN